MPKPRPKAPQQIEDRTTLVAVNARLTVEALRQIDHLVERLRVQRKDPTLSRNDLLREAVNLFIAKNL